MLNQIIFHCVAILKAALQLPCAATSRDERIYVFQIRSNSFCLRFPIPAGIEAQIPQCLVDKIIHETILSTM